MALEVRPKTRPLPLATLEASSTPSRWPVARLLALLQPLWNLTWAAATISLSRIQTSWSLKQTMGSLVMDPLMGSNSSKFQWVSSPLVTHNNSICRIISCRWMEPHKEAKMHLFVRVRKAPAVTRDRTRVTMWGQLTSLWQALATTSSILRQSRRSTTKDPISLHRVSTVVQLRSLASHLASIRQKWETKGLEWPLTIWIQMWRWEFQISASTLGTHPTTTW